MINNYNSLSRGMDTKLKRTRHKKVALLLFMFMFCFLGMNGQVTTNSGSGLNPTYPSLASAVTALNGATISSPVVITLTASETAPVGGYSITATGTLTNTITITGGGFTLTAPTPQASGILTDAIFKIIGGDFITLQGFIMAENAANTTVAAATNNMTEFGVALLYASTTNGAQNCTIQNNTISLNRNYQNTFGIYSNSTHGAVAVTTTVSATTSAGGNSGMKVYGNAISNVNNGIVVVGPTAAADYNTGIDIGGTAIGTANTITNYGTTGTFSGYVNVSGSVSGVLIRNSNGFNVSFNTITSSVGGVTAGVLNGIQIPAFSAAPTTAFTNNINSNTLSLRSGLIAGTVVGISYPSGSASTLSILNINNNDFTNSSHTTATATGAITFITCASTHLTTTINNNTFTNLNLNTVGSVTFISNSITAPAGGSQTISGNSIVTAFNKTGAGGTVTGITTAGSSTTVTSTWSNNNFSNMTVTGATTLTLINNTDGGTVNHNITGNTINNITGGTGTVTGINSNFGGGNGGLGNLVSGNTISNITGTGTITSIAIGSSGTSSTVSNNTIFSLTTTGASAVNGITSSAPTSNSIFKNRIYSLTSNNASGTVNGIVVNAGTLHNVFNNIMGGLSTPSANASNPLMGINIVGGTTSNVHFNTVVLNATSSGALFGSSAFFASTTPAVTLRNNILVNNSTATGAGLSAAHRRSGTTLSTYQAASNNNLFFGGAIFTDGTNTDTSLSTYKTRVSTRDNLSITENPTFTSTVGSNAQFLHVNTSVTTLIESGGVTISGVTDDFDGDVRNLTKPDIGADEFAGSSPAPALTALTISPTGTACTAASRAISVTATTPAGTITGVVLNYALNGVAQSAITMTNTSGNIWDGTIPVAIPSNASVTWTVTATNSVSISTTISGTSYTDAPLTGLSASAVASINPVCASSPTVLTLNVTSSPPSPAPLASTYCASTHSSACSGDNIARVVLNTLDKTTGTTCGTTSSAYSNFTGLSGTNTTTLAAGTAYSLSLTFGTDGNQFFGAWIDYNHNGVYEASEFLGASANAGASGTIAVAFTPSAAVAYNGLTRMRIVGGNDAAVTSAQACGISSSNFGETQDYDVTLTGGINIGPYSGAITSITWNDGASNVGTGNNLSVSPASATTYTATAVISGCPLVSSPVSVTTVALPLAPTATDSSQCGAQIPTASVADPNSFVTPTFKWYAAASGGTALQSNVATTYLASIATTTTFYVTVVNPIAGCESARTPVTVTVSSPTAIVVTPGATASSCQNSTIALGVSNVGAYPTYTWSCPTAGSGIGTPNSATTNITPTGTGTYVYTVTGTDGVCTATATVTVTVAAAPIITIATPSALCAGTAVTLTALTPVISTGTAPIGVSTVSEFSGSVYRYGNGTGTFRHQFIYSGAELAAAGLYSGNLTSIAFNVSSLGSGQGNNFTIKLGTATSTTATTTFQAPTLTQVYTVAAYTTVSGSNVHTFQTPYFWDGIANIVVDICYTTPTTGGSSNVDANTPSVARNTQILATAGGSCTSVTGTTFANRPIATFGGQVATFGPGSLTYTWNDPLTTTGNVLTVSPAVTTVYQVAGFNAATGCTGLKNVTVTVNPKPLAPTAVDSAQCGLAIPTASVADVNAFVTPTFKWYAAASGGTAIQSNVATTYLTAIASTTTFYVTVINPTTSCESNRTPVTVTVATPAPIISIANKTVCAGASFSATATSSNDPNYNYSWTASPAAGSGIPSGSLTGASQTIIPTIAGTYTYTVTANDPTSLCNTSTTFTATVNALPVITTVTAAPLAVCPSGVSTLTVTLPSGVNGYSFASSAGTYTPITGTVLGAAAIGDDVGIGNLPIGFTFNYNGIAQTVFAASSNGLIQLGVTAATISGGSANGLALLNDVIAPFWDDNNTTGGSIIFATTGVAPNRVLTVQWTDMHVGGSGSASNPTISVQAILNENGTIQMVYGPQSAALSAPAASVGISGIVGVFKSVTPLTPLSASTVSSATENVSVTGINLPVGSMFTFAPQVPASIVWSPTASLYTDLAATIPYTGTPATTVYAKPTVSGANIYTATATSAAACSATATATVTQNGIVVTPITGGATSICLGSASVIDFNSNDGTTNWTTSNPSVATIDSNGILTVLSTGTTIIGANETSGPPNNCTSYAANPQTVNVYAPVAISAQPIDQSVLNSGATLATFTVGTTGSVLSSGGYQWESSIDDISYTPLTNTAPYSGVNTATLSLTNADILLNGIFYRCVVNGFAPCATPLTSESAVLTVASLTINPIAALAPICVPSPSTGTVTVNATLSIEPDAVQWQISADGITYDDITAANVPDNGLTFSGFDTLPLSTSSSLTITGLTAVNNGWKLKLLASSGATVVSSNIVTIVVNIPVTVSAPANQTVCYSGGTSTFTVNAPNATGFVWEYNTDNTTWGTPVVNGTPAGATYTNVTTASLSVATTAATPSGVTYYYRAVASSPTPCAAIPSASATLSITDFTIAVIGDAGFFCSPSGVGVNLTASGTATSYSWSPATGLSATTGASVIATPLVTTTYTVTGTYLGCTKTAQVTVISGRSITPVASATPSTICAGSNSQLLVVTPESDTTPAGYTVVGSSGTYTPITGTTLAAGSIGDDVGIGNLPIGFTFNYNGIAQTVFGASSNGFIQLGNTSATIPGFSSNALATTTNVIAPFWDDNNTTGGSIVFATTGSAPNRVLTVQWTNMHVGGFGSATNPTISVQALISENGNIEFRYGPKSAVLSSPTASVGLSGIVGNFSSVTPLTPITTSTSSKVTENTSVTDVNLPSGTVLSFTPGFAATYTYAWTPNTFIVGQETLANPVAINVTSNVNYTVTVTSNAGCVSTAMVALTTISGVTPAIPAATVAVATICQGTAATFNVVATGPSLTYQWRKGGVNIDGVANPSALTATLSLTATTALNSGAYDVVITPLCGAAATSSSVSLLVNPTPTVTAPTTQTYCAGITTGAIAIVGTPSGVTYSITGGAAIGLSDVSGITSVPSFTTIAGTATISVTPSANGCPGTAVTYVITVNGLPTAITITPASSTICSNGTPVLLTASGGIITPTGYCIPTVSQVGTTGDNITNFTFAGINNTTGDGPGDYNYYPTPSATVVAGVATPFSITPNSAFGQQFRVWIDMNRNGIFEATESVFNTTTSSTVTVAGNITVPTTAFNGITRMRVEDRFSSVTTTGDVCALSGFGEFEDYNVTISGGVNQVPLAVWTSTNGGLFTDAAGTIAYTGTASTTVYARPIVTATVTATVTSPSSCTNAGTAVITVNPAPTLSSVAQAAAVCPGTLATINLSGLVAGSTSSVTYSIAGGTSTTVAGVVASGSGTGSFTVLLTTPNNGQVLTVSRIVNDVTTCLVAFSSNNTVTLAVTSTSPFYADVDLDGYGAGPIVLLCAGGSTVGYSVNNLDCNDNNAQVNPNHVEVAGNSIDDNCSGTADEVGPTVNVIASQCGSTLTLLSNTIFCTTNTTATGYRFEVSSGAFVRSYDSVTNRFNLLNIPGASYATTYSVRVSIKVGGFWQVYGTACNITSPAGPPTTNVIPSQCGMTITNFWNSIFVNQVTEATGYLIECTDAVNGARTYVIPNGGNRFNLRNFVGGAVANTVYTIRVAIRYNGVYQAFGAPCTITTSPGAVRESEATNTDVFAVNAYPNPFAENFKLDINTTSAERVEVKVYDMIGKLIEVRNVNVSELTTQEVGDRYSSGVYNVIVTQGANVKTLRVIKR